jgi:SnoaL-like domain
MTEAKMTAALDEVQAKLAGADLLAEWFHGVDGRDLERAMATWHPAGVLSFESGLALDGQSAVEDFLEKLWARYSEVYHWVSNLALAVHCNGTMRGECRVTALCIEGSGAPIREIGTLVLDCTRVDGTWLISRQTVTIRRREPPSSRR